MNGVACRLQIRTGIANGAHSVRIRSPAPTPHRAALAQLVEHIIRNDGVTCSSHVSGTIMFPTYPASIAWTFGVVDAILTL